MNCKGRIPTLCGDARIQTMATHGSTTAPRPDSNELTRTIVSDRRSKLSALSTARGSFVRRSEQTRLSSGSQIRVRIRLAITVMKSGVGAMIKFHKFGSPQSWGQLDFTCAHLVLLAQHDAEIRKCRYIAHTRSSKSVKCGAENANILRRQCRQTQLLSIYEVNDLQFSRRGA